MRYFSMKTEPDSACGCDGSRAVAWSTKKANIMFAFFRVVGPDGLEPPTYAL
jgi:hypothetical protein